MGSPQKLAGNGNNGTYTPFNLYAGEKEVVHDRAKVAAGVAVQQFQVLAKNANGELIIYDPTASAPANKALCVALNAKASGETNRSLSVAVSAFYNHEALIWPATIDTLAKRKLAFEGTEIRVGALA